MPIKFSEELNPEQLEVVLHGDGPCLVLAGAGSGKTRVITYRVAYLLEQGIHPVKSGEAGLLAAEFNRVNPENILLVTFTNKAADEMIRRMQQLTGSQERLPWAGTFHHIAYRILRIYAPILGYKNSFTVLDSDDSETLIKLCVKNYKTEGEGKKFPSAKVLQSIISYARNSESTIYDVLELKYPQWLTITDQIKSIADEYYLKKKEANAMDFDDLLVNFLNLLSGCHCEYPSGHKLREAIPQNQGDRHAPQCGARDDSAPVLKKFAEQFQYILVDEYQDTNKIQASIIKKLASVHNNILVVGDDAQSIYSFRAADIANILQFEKDYPNAKVFKLETNYRSSQEILRVANEVIANNVKQYKKELKTLSVSGLKPALHPQMDQSGEAEFVAQKILELTQNGVPENEIAVLFRAAHHSQMLEMELVKAGIVYDYRGGLRFFERAHVKDVLAYLRILNNFADTSAWMRVLMHEEGIGPAAANKIVEALKSAMQNVVIPSEAVADEGSSSQSTANHPSPLLGKEGMTEISHFIRNDIPALLGEKAKNGWYNFVRIWESMLSATGNSPLGRGRGGLDGRQDSIDGQPTPGLEAFPAQAGSDKVAPAALIDAVIGSPYKDYLESEFLDSKDRLEDIAQLQVFAKKYNELEEFLAEASLQESFNIRGSASSPPARPASPELQRGEGGAGGGGSGKIVLSTIHQAKGLEWSAVFIINLASGAFPGDRAFREPNGLEEERRLFYVAVTRAKKHLYLTYPMTGGGWGDTVPGPSLFLGEISSDLLDDHSLLSADNGLVLNDEEAGVTYEAEDQPLRIKPGSFLRSVEDL